MRASGRWPRGSSEAGDKGSTELLRGLLNVNEFLYVD